MKHKKGFAADLLTLIISALLSVSAFAASDGFSDVPEDISVLRKRRLPCRAGHYLRYGKTAGMHRTHRLRCANGQQ